MPRTFARYIPFLIILGLCAPQAIAGGTHRDRQQKARAYDQRKAERDSKREVEHAKTKARDDARNAKADSRRAQRDADRAHRTSDDSPRTSQRKSVETRARRETVTPKHASKRVPPPKRAKR